MTGICGGGRRAGDLHRDPPHVEFICIADCSRQVFGPSSSPDRFPRPPHVWPWRAWRIRGLNLAASSNSGNGRLTILNEFTFPLMLRSFIVRVSRDLKT